MTDAVDTASDDGPAEWVRRLGIIDLQSGLDRARDARQLLIDGARAAWGSSDEFATYNMIFAGLTARAQGLHEGAIAAIEAGNPYAAFTLLRSYSENAAAILYLMDHPTMLDKFWQDPKGVKIGRITNHARKRFAMFAEIYDQLSQFAHPASRSILASFKAGDEGQFSWSSAPRFKSESDAITACAWVVELAQATGHLLDGLTNSTPS